MSPRGGIECIFISRLLARFIRFTHLGLCLGPPRGGQAHGYSLPHPIRLIGWVFFLQTPEAARSSP